MTEADALVLKALEPSARAFVDEAEWSEILAAVEKAGGVRQVDGYAKAVLEKAKSFGGNRSAAGSYAARMRWRGSNSEGLAGAQAKAESEALQSFPDLKRGARVRQKLPNGQMGDLMTVSSRKGDMIHLRPDVGPRGYYEHKHTLGLHRRFWDSLEVDPSAPPAP